jgi:sec-independent protein translocase protein TatC
MKDTADVRNPFKTHRDEMPFLDHLEELRWRLLWSALGVFVATIFGFFLVNQFNVLGLLIIPVEPFLDGSKLKYLSPMDPFFITLKLALTVGIILSSPIIIYQIWAFLSPALLPSEKRMIVPALYVGVLLFLCGVAMGYYMVLPLTLKFSMGFQTAALEQSIVISEYLGFVTRLLIAFGVVFELPVVLVVLAALGIVTPEFLADKRRHAIAIITVGACVITPGDIASSILMIVPLLFLYEVSIAMAKVLYRKRVASQPALEV